MSTKSKVPANNDTPIFPIDHTLIAHNVSNQFKTPVKLGLEIGACMTDKDTNGIKKTACVIDKTADIAITQGVRMTARGNIAVGVPLIAGGLAAKVIVNEQTYKRDNHTFFDRTLLLTYEKKMQFYEEHKFDTDDLGALKYTEPELPKSSASRCEVTNTVTVRSLLELINGPAPISGAIYIATTNHLDELKEICPALFRTCLLYTSPSPRD